MSVVLPTIVGVLIYAFCDEGGLWHGFPEADVDSSPQTGVVAVPHGEGRFGGQRLLVRFASIEDSPGACTYLVEGRRYPLYATWDVEELLGDWSEPGPAASTVLERIAELESTAGRELEQESETFFEVDASQRPDGQVQVSLRGCDRHGEVVAELHGAFYGVASGDLLSALLAAAGRALLAESGLAIETMTLAPDVAADVAAGADAARRGKPWTDEERAMLEARFAAGSSPAAIAAELGRSETAVGWKLWEAGLGVRPSTAVSVTAARVRSEPAYTMDDLRRVHPNSHRRWSIEEEERLAARVRAGASLRELVEEFGRNSGGISSRLGALGLAHLLPGPSHASVTSAFPDSDPIAKSGAAEA